MTNTTLSVKISQVRILLRATIVEHTFVQSLQSRDNCYYYMTIFASGPEREIQRFDWFLGGLELAVPDR